MAQAYVRLSVQVSPEVAEKLNVLAVGTTKTAVIEQAILALYGLRETAKKNS